MRSTAKRDTEGPEGPELATLSQEVGEETWSEPRVTPQCCKAPPGPAGVRSVQRAVEVSKPKLLDFQHPAADLMAEAVIELWMPVQPAEDQPMGSGPGPQRINGTGRFTCILAEAQRHTT